MQSNEGSVSGRTEGADSPRIERVLAGSFRLALIPVIVLVLAALGAFIYGTAVFVHSVRAIVDHPSQSAIRSGCSFSTSTSSS
jgi:uncharacterized membrane protein YqhA